MTDEKRYPRRRPQPLRVTNSLLAVLALDCLLAIYSFPLLSRAAMVYPGFGWWTLFTYPLAADPLSLVLAGLWLYLAGSALEARWGSLRFGLFLALSVPLSSLPLFLGASALHGGIILAGPFLPLACLTVAWCLSNWDGFVLLGFLVPIPTKVLLILEFILVYVISAMTMPPLLAILALAGPGLSYFYARYYGPEAKVLGAIKKSGRKRAAERRRRKGLRMVKP